MNLARCRISMPSGKSCVTFIGAGDADGAPLVVPSRLPAQVARNKVKSKFIRSDPVSSSHQKTVDLRKILYFSHVRIALVSRCTLGRLAEPAFCPRCRNSRQNAILFVIIIEVRACVAQQRRSGETANGCPVHSIHN